ncbi:MFS transporter [Cryptosporangium aurantiacum]|uniref:Predicted arabinose efflux permease, MFS family n=1 Tax=Cryptosporangium aurantiacum TaxID=134849 RepID=A0A1M7RBL2_9ACTN|nr:MFS transporter [Cryptosporangium aurantiacum]SHN43653.1 Predicted arabinose efflux permease, MFS family [Cryptosporangium aurantiacum]
MDRDGLTVVPEAAGAPARPHGAFRALRSTPFRWYFAGQIASASGTFVQQTAVAWLVLQLTGSAASLGLVLAVGGIPSLLFGPFGGGLADRFDLRRLLIVTQATFGLLAAVLWLLAANGDATVPVVLVITVVGALVGVVDSPARQAFVGALVPPDDLASAVSLNGVVMNSARVVGPAVAGVLIAAVGTTPCFAVNAVSYLAVLAALAVVRPLSGVVSRSRGGGLRDALHYACGREQLWLPLTMMAIVGLLAFNFGVVLPVLAKETFHGSGGTYGAMSTVLSVGSVLGSLGVGLVRHPRRRYLMAAALVFGLALAATAAAPTLAVAFVTLFATGAAGFTFVTLASTTLQLHSSPAYRGRILALWVFVYLGTTPIGSAVTGWVLDAGGPRAGLLVGAVACFVAAVLAARVRTPANPDALLTDLPAR